MNTIIKLPKLSKLKSTLDWNLLLFLILFLNVKLAVKLPAIVLIYLLRTNFRFGFNLKNSRLPLFYLLAIAIALIDFIINRSYATPNYTVVFITGIGFWVLCILAVHQVKLSVERNDEVVIHRTIIVFFVANAVISLINIASIIGETGALNPYTYQGDYQKYFIGTGDYIRGLTFDTSTTNAVLNAMGVMYFLTKKNAVMLLTCMAVMLLTGSNYVNIVLVFILALAFLFNSTRDQKSLIVVCLMLLIVFMVKISPQNNDYAVETIEIMLHRNQPKPVQTTIAIVPLTGRADSVLSPDERRQKIAKLYLDSLSKVLNKHAVQANNTRKETELLKTEAGRILVPKPDINSAPYQSLVTTPRDQLQLVDFIHAHQASLPISGNAFQWSAVPGKVTAMLQTLLFFRRHPAKLFTGDGPGNFSSKLAFRASGLGFSGGFPPNRAYINHDFLANHLDLYLNFFSKRAGYHSLTNSPFSVYDQLLAEYGLTGLVLFLIYYIGFFAGKWRLLTYGLPVLLFTLAILFIDYWFEQLSVLVFFELIMFLNLKEGAALQPQ